ncbi:hypothetical protein CRENPOLYSF1_480023 [Crenothrix polyspora]|uniref:Uncharacterized protein n=1 Tax=Crenothrix polyspora TaxID=360316 RepID=A0A1R4HC61_9GAMM|nr:hypothetical protein CRENPOLYSF1_480023 [Crenothrix polyspora]
MALFVLMINCTHGAPNYLTLPRPPENQLNFPFKTEAKIPCNLIFIRINITPFIYCSPVESFNESEKKHNLSSASCWLFNNCICTC